MTLRGHLDANIGRLHGLDRCRYACPAGPRPAYCVKRHAGQAEYRERLEAAYLQYEDICEAVGAAPGCEMRTKRRPRPARPGRRRRPGSCAGTAWYCTTAGAGRTHPRAAAEADALSRRPRTGPSLPRRCRRCASTGTGRSWRRGTGRPTWLHTLPRTAFWLRVIDLEREHHAVRQVAEALAAQLICALQAAAMSDAGIGPVGAHIWPAALLLATGAYVGVPDAGTWAALVATEGRPRAAPLRAGC